MRIVVLSDNKALRRDLVAKHSLSILVEVGVEKYLFGMGADYYVIEHNSKVLDADLATVDCIVVSHAHVPHFGGYRYLAEESPLTPTIIPYGTGESLGNLLRQHGLKPLESRTWVKLGEGVYVSQSFYGPPFEHYLIVSHSKGLVLFTGCAHPGIGTLEEVAKYLGKSVYAIIGGFHMQSAPRDVVERRAKNLVYGLKPSIVVPLHCSGRQFAEELRRTGIEVLEGGAGLEIEL